MQQTIQMMKVESYPHIIDQGYTLRSLKGLLGRISRALWWALGKLKALQPLSITQEYIRYEPVHQDNLMEEFREQYWHLLGRGLRADELCLICGAEDFNKLIADQEVHRSRSFTLPVGDLHYGFRGYRGSIEGIQVHVVPHLRGYAIIEKSLGENQSKPIVNQRRELNDFSRAPRAPLDYRGVGDPHRGRDMLPFMETCAAT